MARQPFMTSEEHCAAIYSSMSLRPNGKEEKERYEYLDHSPAVRAVMMNAVLKETLCYNNPLDGGSGEAIAFLPSPFEMIEEYAGILEERLGYTGQIFPYKMLVERKKRYPARVGAIGENAEVMEGLESLVGKDKCCPQGLDHYLSNFFGTQSRHPDLQVSNREEAREVFKKLIPVNMWLSEKVVNPILVSSIGRKKYGGQTILPTRIEYMNMPEDKKLKVCFRNQGLESLENASWLKEDDIERVERMHDFLTSMRQGL